jgi:hypothetical protein
MIQIYINDKELDLPVDIINQIGINYEVFTIGEFANKFNSFSGNLTFPNTDTNRRVFGFATDNLNAGIVNREYTGRIVNNAVEVFSGEVNFERYNNGFECRFFTTGQLLIQALQPLDMFDVLLGLPRADVIGTEQWFDHQYSQVATQTFVGENEDGGKNVRYPLLDLGYFNNTNKKIGYFDLRATFSLWTMCLAIAKKVNKTLTFSGTLPDRLFNTFITPKDWKYSDRLIEENKTTAKVLPFSTTYNFVASNASPVSTFNTMTFSIDAVNPLKVGEFELITDSGFLTDVRTPFDCNFNVNAELSFNCIIDYTSQFNQGTAPSISFFLETITSVLFDNVDTVGIQSVSFIDGEQILGTDTATGLQPVARILDDGAYIDFCNPQLFSGQYKIRLPLVLKYQKNRVYEGLIEDARIVPVLKSVLAPYGGDPTLDQSITISFNTASTDPNEPDFILQHNEVILANGFISGTDLMGSLKPADVMKYAMRLTGSYLVETETTLTLVPFANYQSSTPTNWSGKANLVNGITVDYLNNNLGENNYLKYKEDDTNTPLDPYYLAGNLPTNIGTVDNILYESVFAQSAFNETFTGAVSLVRVPYYDAPIAYYYRVWINDATAYLKGQFVGYLGRLFKVLTNTTGSAGTPLVNAAAYEEVDYSVFNDQSPTYRAIEVLTDQVTGVQVYGGTGTLLYTNTITAGLNGIDLQQSVNDTYGFIPSTFLDFRQIEVELMLTSIDIANLDLKKLVRIDELNGTFYVNALSNYTPDVSVPTKAILTLIP